MTWTKYNDEASQDPDLYYNIECLIKWKGN